MSLSIAFGHSRVNVNENSCNKNRSSPSWPPQSSGSVALNPTAQRESKKDRKVLQEKSRDGVSSQGKPRIPPRPLSHRSFRSKEPRNKNDPNGKSSLKSSIWRFDVKEVEEKQEEAPLSTCCVVLTSLSEVAGPLQTCDWHLPMRKSHRRALSWDAGDHSLWLSSNHAKDSNNWSEEQKHNCGDNANQENLKQTITSGVCVEEPSYEENNDPRPIKSRETFQQLRQAIRIARIKAMMENSWANYKTLAQLLRRLAGIYFENEEVFAAQATLEDALEMHQHVLACSAGDDRCTCLLEIGNIICNLGSIELQHKNFELAIGRFTEALDIQTRVLKKEHPKVIASLDNLGYSLSKCKSYDQALYCYDDMLNAQFLYYETFNAECYETLGKQLLMYGKLNDWKGASKAAKRALEKALNLPKISNEYIEKLQKQRTELKAKRKWWRR